MWLNLDKESSIPLIRQVYGQLKLMILEGKLQEGAKLPSTRWLSKDLGISRNVILEAYDQLTAEGYIEGRQGSGTKVSKGLNYKRINKDKSLDALIPKVVTEERDIIDFRSGIPALDMFPKKEWGRLYNNICMQANDKVFAYCGAEGRIELRQALSKYLFRVRGINCCPEQIMIISGSTQGLSLVSELLYSENAEVIVEDPIHYGLLKVISNFGYTVKAVPVDSKGIKTNMITSSSDVSLVYVTPSHQFPLGGVLPIQRRIELIKFAKEKDCYIIEDDYDSEFRYDGYPISSLYELEPNRVIYVGSFSKIFSPALRLGYMILPQSLIPKYLELKKYSDVHTEAISQLTMAQFIHGGSLEKHLWKMKKEYIKKREAIIKSLDYSFPGIYEIEGHAAGLHLVAVFKNYYFTEEVIERIKQEKVKVYPVECYTIEKGNHYNKLILGYGHLSVAEIEEGIKRLRRGMTCE